MRALLAALAVLALLTGGAMAADGGDTYPPAGLKVHNPDAIAAPAGAYSQGVEVAPGARWLAVAGQTGVRPDGSIPADFAAQTEVALANVEAVLESAGMSWRDVVRLDVFLTDRANVRAWSETRSRLLGDARPAGTLLVVKSLVRPEYLIEVEALAARVE